MIQAIIKKGKVIGENIPAPNVSKGCVLIKVVNSCISAGTEMSGVQNSSKSLIRRALDQPENLKAVISMTKSLGISKTYAKIRGKVDGGTPTGYSISGVVIALGEGVDNFRVGDRVAAAGAGLANHAEFVDVPVNLVMKMPGGLSFKDASTATLGGIAMQGVRRADIRLGEYVVVIGAGILGLLSLQMLKTSGGKVIVIDLDESRLEIAKELGASLVINPLNENTVELVNGFTHGYGADCVLFTAATQSSEPLSEAFQMCRKKGKVVLVGVVGMQINRADIYKKELDFQISTSYGPGRYDSNYEEKGIDYPYAYVRWTENRNMVEYLRLVNDGDIKLDYLINAIFKIEDMSEAFGALKSKEKRPLMVLLDYGEMDLTSLEKYLKAEKKIVVNIAKKTKEGVINVALVGAGSFATTMHLPNIKKLNKKFKLHAVMDRIGHKAKAAAQQFSAKYATTNYSEILNDEEVDLALIATRHDSHAALVLDALKAGKHVFVEKPLATNEKELKKIEEFYNNGNSKNKPILFTGFNRRFSKYSREIKKHTDKRINPLLICYRMNAGYIPRDHWIHENGGRIVGECCHIIDLMTYFTESEIKSVSVESLTPLTKKYSDSDNKSITLKYKDGSVASIEYFSVGNKGLSKEQLEIHFDGKSVVMDNYKSLKGYGIKVRELSSTLSKKGQFEEMVSLSDCLLGKIKKWPIELWDMTQTTRVSFLI